MKEIARKSKSRTSLNFTFKRNISYLVFILFTRVKLTSTFTQVKITRQRKFTLKDKTPIMGAYLRGIRYSELQFGCAIGSPPKGLFIRVISLSWGVFLFAAEQALFVRIFQASEGKRKASEKR